MTQQALSSADAGQINPFTARFLTRIPADVAASFTPEQLHAVQIAFGMRYTADHGVDIRRMLSLPWGRYYLVVLGGRDWRREGRRGWAGRARRLVVDTLACLVISAGMALSAWRVAQIVIAVAV